MILGSPLTRDSEETLNGTFTYPIISDLTTCAVGINKKFKSDIHAMLDIDPIYNTTIATINAGTNSLYGNNVGTSIFGSNNNVTDTTNSFIFNTNNSKGFRLNGRSNVFAIGMGDSAKILTHDDFMPILGLNVSIDTQEVFEKLSVSGKIISLKDGDDFVGSNPEYMMFGYDDTDSQSEFNWFGGMYGGLVFHNHEHGVTGNSKIKTFGLARVDVDGSASLNMNIYGRNGYIGNETDLQNEVSRINFKNVANNSESTLTDFRVWLDEIHTAAVGFNMLLDNTATEVFNIRGIDSSTYDPKYTFTFSDGNILIDKLLPATGINTGTDNDYVSNKMQFKYGAYSLYGGVGDGGSYTVKTAELYVDIDGNLTFDDGNGHTTALTSN